MSFFGFFAPNVTALVDRRDVRGLIKALGYERDWRVRQAAAEALERIGNKDAMPALFKCLRDFEDPVRLGAVKALARIGNKEDIISPFIEQLNDQSPLVQITVVSVLARLGDDRAVEPLIARLGKSTDEVRKVIEEALLSFGAVATTKLSDTTVTSKPDTRREAAFLLGTRKDPQAIEPLFTILDEERLDYGHRAVALLAQFHKPEVVKVLIKTFERARFGNDNRDKQLTMQLINVLGEMGDPQAVDCLIADIERYGVSMDDARRKSAAAGALGRIGDLRAVPVLAHNIDWGAQDGLTLIGLQEACADAFRHIGVAAVKPLLELMDGPSAGGAVAACQLLLMEKVEEINAKDLRALAIVKARKLSWIADEDTRTAEEFFSVIDCTALHDLARAELQRRGLKVPDAVS